MYRGVEAATVRQRPSNSGKPSSRKGKTFPSSRGTFFSKKLLDCKKKVHYVFSLGLFPFCRRKKGGVGLSLSPNIVGGPTNVGVLPKQTKHTQKIKLGGGGGWWKRLAVKPDIEIRVLHVTSRATTSGSRASAFGWSSIILSDGRNSAPTS